MKKNLLIVFSLLVFSVSQASAIGVGAWGGYNIPSYTGKPDCSTISSVSGQDCKNGGIAFGGDFWMMGLGPVQLGIGGGLLPVGYTKTVILTKTIEKTTRFAPVLGQFRFDVPLVGVFFEVGLGYGVSVSTYTTTAGTAPDKPTGAFTGMGVVGYALGLGPVSVDMGVRYYAIINSSSTLSNIIPFAGVTLKI